MGAGTLQYVLGSVGVMTTVRMDRNQDIALLQLALVLFGFELRNS